MNVPLGAKLLFRVISLQMALHFGDTCKHRDAGTGYILGVYLYTGRLGVLCGHGCGAGNLSGPTGGPRSPARR